MDKIVEAVRRLKKSRSDIQAIYLFGAFASGVPTPKNDADLLIAMEGDRTDDFRTAFHSVSVPNDLHILNPTSFTQRKTDGKGIVAAVVRHGKRLLCFIIYNVLNYWLFYFNNRFSGLCIY